jgi:hypothetical protein
MARLWISVVDLSRRTRSQRCSWILMGATQIAVWISIHLYRELFCCSAWTLTCRQVILYGDIASPHSKLIPELNLLLSSQLPLPNSRPEYNEHYIQYVYPVFQYTNIVSDHTSHVRPWWCARAHRLSSLFGVVWFFLYRFCNVSCSQTIATRHPRLLTAGFPSDPEISHWFSGQVEFVQGPKRYTPATFHRGGLRNDVSQMK